MNNRQEKLAKLAKERVEHRKNFIAEAKKKKSENTGVTKENIADTWRNLLNDNPEEFFNHLESINSKINEDPKLLYDSYNNSVFENYAITLHQSIKNQEEKTQFLSEKYLPFLEIMSAHVNFLNSLNRSTQERKRT